MRFTDHAIIIGVTKFSESSLVLDLFSNSHGRFKGFIKGALKSKNRNVLQLGNFVYIEHRVRTNNQLGNIKILEHEDLSTYLIADFSKLLAVNSLCAIIRETIHQGESSAGFYKIFRSFLSSFKNQADWITNYINLEVELISLAGYGMDLKECGATGTTENLKYVSPKTARAICEEAGKPYHSKMLELPQFLINKNNPIDNRQISTGLKLTRFFLDKFFKEHNKELPYHRLELEGRFSE